MASFSTFAHFGSHHRVHSHLLVVKYMLIVKSTCSNGFVHRLGSGSPIYVNKFLV